MVQEAPEEVVLLETQDFELNGSDKFADNKVAMTSVCTSSGAEEDPLVVNSEDSNVEEDEVVAKPSWDSEAAQQTTTTVPPEPSEEAAFRPPLCPPTATWLRVVATIYFVTVTFAFAMVSSTCLIGVIGAYKTLDLLGYCIKETEANRVCRLCRRENTVGLIIDVFVRLIMKASSWIFTVEVLGDGCPVDKMTKDELAAWEALHRQTRNNIDFCKLPRRKADNRIRLPGACMVMCNHLSNIDGFSLKSALFPSVSKAIIKSEVKYVPFIGWTVALSGQPLVHFTGDKGGWGTTRKAELVLRCKEVIGRNFPLLVYPEGARQRFGRMAPFRYGMFNLAIENGYPILPSVIHGSEKAWPVHSPLVDFANIYLKFSDELILPKKGDSVEDVISAVRNKMLELLEGIPNYDPLVEAPILNVEEYAKLELEATESRKKK
eukprot:Gregarina_sp_Pseudo_9__5405@NODE_663_length_2403_cov_533_815567_g626_i0_p1_GENE_NODE_663_length_2403_cov_533_815567_g626_i0NODE_663_length_2403_cov_533_815567_g626_i0_p1_ORF_typecomplete_len434_score95_49Acyltransferase/PF01553_21/4e16_NODE_663_length_2403_cov_533_815567_g626_i0811382